MDKTKLNLTLASLASGVVLLLSLFGIIPADKVDSLGIAINQITGAVSGILMLFFPSIAEMFRKQDSRKEDSQQSPEGGFAQIVLLAIIGALSVAMIAGCQTFTEPPVALDPVAATSPKGTAQASINTGLSAILALGQTVRSDAESGITTVYEANRELAKLADAKSNLDRAQKFLDRGDVGSAQTQIEIASKLINALRIEIAVRARKDT